MLTVRLASDSLQARLRKTQSSDVAQLSSNAYLHPLLRSYHGFGKRWLKIEGKGIRTGE